QVPNQRQHRCGCRGEISFRNNRRSIHASCKDTPFRVENARLTCERLPTTLFERRTRITPDGSPGKQVRALLTMLRRRDPATGAHSLRVKEYALDCAEALGLDEHSQWRLGLAALLHDIGKLRVSHAILHKPGLLSAQERGVVAKHAVDGETMVAFLRNRTVLQAVRSHHERYDGTGYPDGLKGRQIPLLARLLAVADCFDALTSARSYKPALSWSEAMTRLRRGAGSQYDPDMVPICFDALIRCGAPRYFSQVPSEDYSLCGASRRSIGAMCATDVKIYRSAMRTMPSLVAVENQRVPAGQHTSNVSDPSDRRRAWHAWRGGSTPRRVGRNHAHRPGGIRAGRNRSEEVAARSGAAGLGRSHDRPGNTVCPDCLARRASDDRFGRC
ncbi:MAG: HD-GYP domain-containing protein, partial [Planctomycetes bacterium]|nr:HD-GYP domain-containing protein [Planctomycetota bacterium]